MGKRFHFDIAKAIPAAWDFCWKDNVDNLQKGPAYRESFGKYLTASDIVEQVRRFAYETAQSKEWGSTGRAWGREQLPVRLSGFLLSDVRSWLQSQVRCGKISEETFGRGHISGARYRPAGIELSEAEKKTKKVKEARKDRPRPVHYSERGWGSPPLCQKSRKRASWRPSKAWSSKEKDKVTCKACLNLLAKQGVPA